MLSRSPKALGNAARQGLKTMMSNLKASTDQRPSIATTPPAGDPYNIATGDTQASDAPPWSPIAGPLTVVPSSPLSFGASLDMSPKVGDPLLPPSWPPLPSPHSSQTSGWRRMLSGGARPPRIGEQFEHLGK